jgi:hypothetical protein
MKKFARLLFYFFILNWFFFIETKSSPSQNSASQQEQPNQKQNADAKPNPPPRAKNTQRRPTEQRATQSDVDAITVPLEILLKYSPTQDEYYKIFKTFTNTTKNISTIMKALAIYEQNGTMEKGKIIIEVDDDGEIDESEYSQFANDKYSGNIYLKSILFTSPDYWSVWVNDEKISNITNKKDREDSEFFIEEIKKDEVKLVRMMSKNKWRYMNSMNYVSTDKYKINETTNKVELTLVLHPNQTFVVVKDKIIDGRQRNEILRVDNIESTGGDNINNIDTNEEVNLDDLFNNPQEDI